LTGLRNVPGVIKYFGWYRIDETENPLGPQGATYNILLEYGEQDLDEYLASRRPPVLNHEIINFWEDIFRVATTLKAIHNLDYRGPDGATTPFLGWHGDIKPSNILFAQGQFKLADFGFTKFEPSSRSAEPMTYLSGLTYTYGMFLP
jgi:serine/threonine protein kinase